MNSVKRKIYRTRIAFHAYTWFALFVVYTSLAYFISGGSLGDTLTASLSYMVFFAVIPVYISYALHNRFINKKQYFLYFLSLVLLIVVSGTCSYYYFTILHDSEYHYVQWLGNAIFVVLLGTAVKVLKEGIKERIQIHEIKSQQLESELALLKSQIDPHFFFNTLNNLYALSLMKSEQVPGVILKLSELMRYILTSSKENKVALAREHEFLQTYLYLQKFRFTHNQNIRYDVEGDMTGKEIAPMLLMPFVENSFKHGVRAVTDQFYIQIKTRISGQELTFTVDNSKPNQNEHLQSDSMRMGLTNVKRRLELLYPDNHTLEIHDYPDRYSVMLRLEL